MLKKTIIGAGAALALGAGLCQAADLSINLNVIGEARPGVYGRLDISNGAPPPLVYSQPVVVAPPPPQAVAVQPLYLHVPPEHARDWKHHCQRYHACDRPVYFVRSDEYRGHHEFDEHVHHEDRGHHDFDEHAHHEDRGHHDFDDHGHHEDRGHDFDDHGHHHDHD